MPLPTPRPGESQQQFIIRCMGNPTAIEDFPSEEQRASVCHSQWDRRNNASQPRASPITINTRDTRRENLDGREQLVVPVIALVEGVVNGELALASEFARYPDAWNGRPVTIQHPTQDGQPITANTPEVLETSTVGMLFNTWRDGDRLMTEAWIDLAKARQLGGEAWEAVQALEAGTPNEVSTGYFTHVNPTTGEHNGEAYSGVQYGVVPDHLALLPGTVGGVQLGGWVRSAQVESERRRHEAA